MLASPISWVHVLGVWVAALLIAFEALFFGVLGRRPARWSRGCAGGRWRRRPAGSLVEFAYARVPFGGFGWTRLAYAAVDTPLAGFFPLIGVAGVSFVVALVGQLVAWVGASRSVTPRGGPAPTGCAAALPRSPCSSLGVAGAALRPFQVEPLAGAAGSVTSASSRATSRAGASRRWVGPAR